MALLEAFIILLASLAIAKLSEIFMEKYVARLASKTQTTLDDAFVSALKVPVFFAILIFGGYAALLESGLFSVRVERIFYALWVVLGASVLIKLGSAALGWASKKASLTEKQTFKEILSIVKHVWDFAVILLAVLMILENFNVKITPLLASLGIAGLAAALALQETVANFFAGLFIVADQPVRIGDYIRLGSGEDGYVEKIGWRSTRIRTLKGNMVIIPNSKLTQSIITNYYSPQKAMAIVIPCSVAYGSDLSKVEKITAAVAKDVLQKTAGGVKTFEPFIRYNSFGDSGIGFSVILQVEAFADQYLVTHEFIKALHERYQKAGIEIPYPKRHVYLEDLGKNKKGKAK